MIDRTFIRCYQGSPIIALVIVLALVGPLSGQSNTAEQRVIGTAVTSELYSPLDYSVDGKAKYNEQLAAKSCLSLLDLKWGCNRGATISYGNRFGDNWDILAFHGTQSRMIDLGKAELSGEVDVPYIAPYRALAPGEKRHIAVNTSGGDGADGRPGRNADGTREAYTPRPKRESYADKPVAHQVSSKTETESGEIFEDTYNPFLEAKAGHVYALRVVENKIDRYFLLRVDEVVKGQKIRVTVKPVDAPARRPIH